MRTTTETYRPDPYVTAGCRWARDKGIPNHSFNAYRVGDHAHVVNCMFDMTTLAAVVTEGKPGYAAHVEPCTRCLICQPLRYTFSCSTRSAAPVMVDLASWQGVRQAMRNAIRLGHTDIKVTDDTGRDVTFDIPEACA